jgi:hypothetical protein
MLTLEGSFSQDELFRAYPKVPVASRIIGSVLEMWYSDIDRPIIIDKNRSWVNRLHYIPGYFGIEPKVICPVRNIDEILASFIALQRRKPVSDAGKLNFVDEMLVKSNIPLNDENRCDFLAGPNGILGQSCAGLRQVIMDGKQSALHFVEYDNLLNKPEETIRAIYDFLELEYFNHTFENIENQFRENDGEVYGVEDMHEVRASLNRRSIDPKEILPESILKKCVNAEFWRDINKPAPDGTEETLLIDETTETNNDGTQSQIIGG